MNVLNKVKNEAFWYLSISISGQSQETQQHGLEAKPRKDDAMIGLEAELLAGSSPLSAVLWML